MNFLLVLLSNLKKSNFSEENKWRSNLHKKLNPVAPINIRCERKCCTVISISLRQDDHLLGEMVGCINHCIKECNFPKLTVLNVGCKVMLLKNSPYKYKLVNGSIGIVKKIIFENRNGPRNIPYELPACIIVEFKKK